MLHLNRPPGTSLQIGDDITIHFRRNGAISIEAPDEVNIRRSEIDPLADAAILGKSPTSEPRIAAGGKRRRQRPSRVAGSRP